jgi:signal transduction histidine kinase
MPLPAGAAPPAGRLRLTGYAALHLLLALPALVLFVLDVLGIGFVIAWIGLGILYVTMPATRWLAGRHRAMAARTLGMPVPADHRPVRQGAHLVERALTWLRDPMTWRELAWLVLNCTVGLVMSLLAVLLFVLVVTGSLWLFGVEPLMRARARMDRMLLSYGHTERLEQRVQVLTETRAESVDHSAAELRRIERDLHDGAQARLVALGISLGMAHDLVEDDPAAARRLIAESRESTSAALGDLRSVVRGIHPPVLADRGLAGAVEALALDLSVPVRVTSRLASRPPQPGESAVYFAVAECLANVVKHAGAPHAWVELEQHDDLLRAVVGDDGVGGADPDAGTGMRGVMRRLAAFDGTMSVSSPPGGPTLVTLEVPCASSSPKTTPSSATA